MINDFVSFLNSASLRRIWIVRPQQEEENLSVHKRQKALLLPKFEFCFVLCIFIVLF